MSHKSYLPVLGALTAQSSALNAPRSVRVFGQRAARGARRGLMGLVGLFGLAHFVRGAALSFYLAFGKPRNPNTNKPRFRNQRNLWVGQAQITLRLCIAVVSVATLAVCLNC